MCLLLFSRNCVLLAHFFKQMIAGENKREVKKKKKKKKKSTLRCFDSFVFVSNNNRVLNRSFDDAVRTCIVTILHG